MKRVLSQNRKSNSIIFNINDKIIMKNLILLILLPLFLLSCSEEPTGPSGSDADKIYDGTDEFPVYLRGFTTNITTGQVTYNFTARLIFQIGSMEYWDYNTKKYEPIQLHNIYAQFDKNGRKFSEIIINDSNLTEREDNVLFQGGGIVYPDRVEGIKLYFGEIPNHIIIEETAYTPKIDTLLSFLPNFSFQNIHSGDTINGTKNFAVKWDGVSEEFSRFYIHEQNVDNEKAFWYEGVIKNDGEFIFTPNLLSKAPTGKYLIGIERFEPHTIQLNNQLPFSILIRHTIQKEIYLKK